jgi:GAF domain-containing protein
MEHIGPDDLSEVLDTVRTVGLTVNPDEFLKATLTAIVKLVPCTVATINEIDPSTDRVAFWMEPSSFPVDDDAPDILSRLTGEHPLIRYVTETGDGSARRISDFWSQDEFHDSRLYNMLYQPMGIEYQMAITLPAPRPTVLGLVVSRTDTDFTQRDVAVLNLVRPYLAQAWRNGRDQERLRSLINATKDAIAHGGSGVVLLSNPPEEITPGALVALYRHFGRPSPTSSLPRRVEAGSISRMREYRTKLT